MVFLFYKVNMYLLATLLALQVNSAPTTMIYMGQKTLANTNSLVTPPGPTPMVQGCNNCNPPPSQSKFKIVHMVLTEFNRGWMDLI